MTAPSRSRWGTAFLGFGLGAFCTLALGGGLLWAFLRWRSAEPAGPTKPPAVTRPEFTRLVLGKEKAEVIQAVGKPDGTSQDDQATYWHFKKRTRDPLTSKIDTDVQVVLNDGKVVSIHY